MSDSQETRKTRVEYSVKRLEELRVRLAALTSLSSVPNLTIYAVGSYARKEASQYSDIDLFFLTSSIKKEVLDVNISSLRMFGQIIEVVEELKFPAFSNDGQYLKLIHTNDILEHLGGRIDDHENFFTARMLLLLEGHCLFGEEHFNRVTESIVDSYFSDYPKHSDDFRPRFLLNDICRFWKTLLLNYENKRRFNPVDSDFEATANDDARKIKQKVKNFKLKYSRLTTCFATIASLASTKQTIDTQCVIELTKLTPYERFEKIPIEIPATKDLVAEILESYSWFLEMTGLETEELNLQFSNEEKRIDMFTKAASYGDLMFELLRVVDKEKKDLQLFRNLVI